MPSRFNDRENGESSNFPKRRPEQERQHPQQNLQPRSNEWRNWESDENESNLGERDQYRQSGRRFEPSDRRGEYGPSPQRAHRNQDIQESFGGYPGQQYERGVYGYESPGDERFRQRGEFDQRRPDQNYQFRQNQQRFSGEQSWNQERNEVFGNSGQIHSDFQRGPFFGRGPKGYRRSDERIEEDINERLTQHPFIDATEIEVRVQNGEVLISGTVDDRNAKRIAEDITESVSGVTQVQNQIRVNKNFRQNP